MTASAPYNITLYPSGGDDTAAIQAAIAAVSAQGGGRVNLSPGVFRFSVEIDITEHGVNLCGAGGAAPQNIALPDHGATTTLQWVGQAGGIGIQVMTPFDPTQALRHYQGVRDLMIDGNGLLGTGLQVTSILNGTFENLYVINCTQQCYFVTNYDAGGWGEPTDTQHCHFIRCFWRNRDFASCYSARGMVISSLSPGVANANVSMNRFVSCSGLTVNGDCWYLGDCDNNIFDGCSAFIANGIGGTGNALTAMGGYSNYFHGWSTPGKTHIAGTVSGAWQNSIGNVFFNVDQANATSLPVVDAGCSVQWHESIYGWYNFMLQATPPATSTSPGSIGNMAWDANYIYVCVNPGLWKRAALSGF